MATQRLTIYLLRDVSNFDDALDEDELRDVESRELRQGVSIDGRFYFRRSGPSRPGWATYLDPIVDRGVPRVKTTSTSGLLALRVDGDVFALTFGYGRSFLDQARIERRFGLKVVLNLIDPQRIRSLDTKTFEEMVLSRNTQASRTAELGTFGVDVLRDILRAATGVAPTGSPYKSVSGSDALVLGTRTSVHDLPALLRDLSLKYKSDDYKVPFPWVDQLTEIRDPELTGALDQQLVEQLRVGNTDSTHFALPDTLDWADIDYFQLAPSGRYRYEELDLDEYLHHETTSAPTMTLAQLKSRKVSVRFIRGSAVDSRSSIYQCLVSEQRLKGKLYALVEGRWFAVAETLVAQVDAAIKALPYDNTSLPPAYHGETEDAYNRRLAISQPDRYVLMDRQLVQPEGARTTIEFCDVLGSDGQIIHLKRKSRSSTLSHLFAQGSVSATSLVDTGAREQIRTAIVKNAGDHPSETWLRFIPDSDTRLDRDGLTITYAVVTNSKKSGVEWLPFFSRLNLMQTRSELSRAGFNNIALVRVPLQSRPIEAALDDAGTSGQQSVV